MLIIPKLELPFDSMEELVESGLPTAVIEGTSMHLDIVASTWLGTYVPLHSNLLSFQLVDIYMLIFFNQYVNLHSNMLKNVLFMYFITLLTYYLLIVSDNHGQLNCFHLFCGEHTLLAQRYNKDFSEQHLCSIYHSFSY